MKTQFLQVLEALEEAKNPMAIHEIGVAIWKKHRRRHADTAISARIREIRAGLSASKRTIRSERAGEGKAHHVYWIAPLND